MAVTQSGRKAWRSASFDMHILITNHHLKDFGGSEGVTLDLALEVRAQGHEVQVATLDVGLPFAAECLREGIEVVNLWEVGPPVQAVDLAWVHHAPVFHRWLQLGGRARRVIFSSLSPYEPLEAPPPYASETSLCLANSQETLDRMCQLGVPREQVRIFPNPVGRDALRCSARPSEGPLRRLMVVSNHPPLELLEASAALQAAGIEVVSWGYGRHYALLRPEDLVAADAVVTIGRTVQTALVLGVPVFCYDHFGGPGWLSPSNVEAAASRNYSGRCTGGRLEAPMLVEALLEGFDQARADAELLRGTARMHYALEVHVGEVLELVGARPELEVDVLARWLRDHPADARYLRLMEQLRALEARHLATHADHAPEVGPSETQLADSVKADDLGSMEADDPDAAPDVESLPEVAPADEGPAGVRATLRTVFRRLLSGS